MNKIIRPAGFIAFAAVIGVVALFGFVLADWLLRVAVEEGGSRMLGAKVEVGEAKTSFSPLGFTLDRLQVANPDQPMQNMLEVNSISGKLTLSKLLMGQVIIEDLSATGMRFNTPRKTSGKLAVKAPPPTPVNEGGITDDALAFVSDTLDVDSIMQREPLATLALGKTFKQTSEEVRQTLQKNLADLPDAAKLNDYEKQMKAITQEDIKSPQDLKERVKQLKQLKQSIQHDRDAIVALRDNVRQRKAELSNQYNELKQAPAKDLKNILDKYSPSGSNLGNFSALLFGDTARQWIDTIKPWWKRGSKLMQAYGGGEKAPPPPPRGKGRYIHFATREPTPDFLVRNAHLSAELPLGDVDIRVQDATPQQNILGRPTRVSLQGSKLIALESFTGEAVFDHINPKMGKDSVSWQAKNVHLQGVDLIKSDSLPITLAKAETTILGKLNIAKGQLQADVKSDFTQVQWASGGKNANTVMDVLSGITSFKVDTTLEGKPLSPTVAMNSDLDSKLSQAMKRIMEQKRAALKQRLESRLNAEVEKLAGPYKEQLAVLTQGEGDINQRLSKVEELLKAEVKNGVDAKKQELKKKAADELKKKSKDALKKLGF